MGVVNVVTGGEAGAVYNAGVGVVVGVLFNRQNRVFHAGEFFRGADGHEGRIARHVVRDTAALLKIEVFYVRSVFMRQ